MKRISVFFALVLLCTGLLGCGSIKNSVKIAATTLPVYEFTEYICQGTDITVTRLITESVSCLHDYTLQVSQMRTVECAESVIISGAGLEEFMKEALLSANGIIDASAGIELLCGEEEHNHEHEGHSHNNDPHIWLSPANAKAMAHNIYDGLISAYPQHTDKFHDNLSELNRKFDDLNAYSTQQLNGLSCREIITFHDGFTYMADAFDLTILHAIEEESGAEASAAELIELIELTNEHRLKAIFVETNGSVSAASIISTETGAKVYTLDTAMSGDSYFDAMYHNIDTIKEALQ